MRWFSKSLLEEVVDALERFRIFSEEYSSETELEAIVANRLSRNFDNVHRQFNIEGYIGAKVDIDVQEEVGIEIKLASQLKRADPVHRLFGQAIYYQNRKYGEDLIILIVGTRQDLESPMISEIVDFLNNTLGVEVVTLPTLKKRS